MVLHNVKKMEQKPLTPLTVYSASAGSGKTFSLVQNYLNLIIGHDAVAHNFSKVLAMTFTNKAAWEMKERIVEALDELAYPIRPTKKATKKAKQLLVETKKTTQLEDKLIQERAKRVLSEILHQYENFNVLTIDKFSLRLIRTFSRDLDLQEDFEVTLDQKLLLEQVIDEMLSKVGKDEEITELTLNYAKSNTEVGDKWDFRKGLIEFSQVLTKETEQEYIDQLLKKEFNQDGYDAITADLRALEHKHKTQCQSVYEHFSGLETVVDDYPGKSTGVFKVLTDLPMRTLNGCKPPNAKIQKTITGENIKENHTVDGELMKQLENLFQYEEDILSRHFLLQKLRSNFYNLALLKHISKELTNFKENNNIIGIFEFGQRISELLKDESAPYIYERIGNRYNHYLLDEFQDTSRLQWMNLIPLVHESIAHNYSNLIVGDPKQAIYRFRNGLVEQFVELPSIYNPENDSEIGQLSTYFEKMGTKTPLKSNFRSKKEIVEFNNEFFQQILAYLPDYFIDYYNDVKQNPIKEEGGFVSVRVLDKKEEFTPDELELQFLIEKVRKCVAHGYQPGDICVLVRFKKAGQRLAKALHSAEENFKVISSDSLLVSADQCVQTTIDYLNLRRNSGNKTTQIKFATSFYRLKGKDPLIALEQFWIDGKVGRFDFNAFVEKEFATKETLFFPYENLYDLGQKFGKLMEISELQNPYLHHLFEIMQAYDLKTGPDIRGFIDDWNEKLWKSNIQMPENSEAIKVMTIHKSKGLEFPVVILPSISWDIKPSREEYFIETDEGEVIYSKYKKTEAPNYILKGYQAEYEKLLLDEMNILYVAFTRPSERLYVQMDQRMPSDKSYFSKMHQPASQAMLTWTDGDITKEGKNYFMGTEHEVTRTDTVLELSFVAKDLRDFLWFPELSLQDDEALEQEELNDEQQFGTQLHFVLDEVSGRTELSSKLSQFIMEGKVDKEYADSIEKTATEVYQLLEKQTFYSEAKTILNEQDIIISENEVKRPDKMMIADNTAVVVDFKTGKSLRKHQTQVLNYCQQLNLMDFQKAEGYLLYTNTMELIQVV